MKPEEYEYGILEVDNQVMQIYRGIEEVPTKINRLIDYVRERSCKSVFIEGPLDVILPLSHRLLSMGIEIYIPELSIKEPVIKLI